MKFIKQNLTLLICALVVVLAVVSIFWPFGTLLAGEQSAAQERYSRMSTTVNGILNTQLTIPGVPTTMTGVPTDNIKRAREEVNKQLSAQAEQINKDSSNANKSGRVDPKNNLIPLLEGKPEPNFLPKTLQDQGAVPMQFKLDYETLFPRWTLKLVGADIPAIPPRKEDLSAQLQAIIKARDAARPAGAGSAQSTAGPTETMNFERGKVMETAMKIHMYVDPGAFQIRAWAQSDNPPNEQNIFESLVDGWFMGDVVNAIAKVNNDALKGKDPKDQNVGNAPFKRLMHISVGNDSIATRMTATGFAIPAAGQAVQGTINSLFYLSTATGAPSADAQPPAPGTSAPNTIDLSRSMTGRASGNDYDVVLMQLNFDIDPSALNNFIDALYRQNMGYTVLKTKTKTVDPLERASNGFIYGPTQVIEVELVVEGLLFRSWSQPLMPDAIRTQLGIALDAPAAAK